MWTWLKNLFGYGKSSWEPLDSGDKKTYIGTDLGIEQCEHTDVDETAEVYPLPVSHWEVRDSYLLIPQVTYDFIRCNQCGENLSWNKSDADTLAFRPAFTVAPDVSTDEALAAHDSGATMESVPGKVLINRSENPAADEEDA